VAGCCECGDEPSGSYATELVGCEGNVIYVFQILLLITRTFCIMNLQL
jgi:hypothetical protein